MVLQVFFEFKSNISSVSNTVRDFSSPSSTRETINVSTIADIHDFINRCTLRSEITFGN